MKMKNGEIYNLLIPSLKELLAMKIPFKANYAANKTLNGLKNIETTLNETRTKSLEMFCLNDEKGNPIIEKREYKFKDDFERQKAINQIDELFKEENEVEIHTVSIDLVDKIEGETGGTWINYLIGKFFIETKTGDSSLEVVK